MSLMRAAFYSTACLCFASRLMAQTTSVTVPGGDHRAVCITSAVPGTWTFTVTALTGKVGYIQPQIYSNSHPTKTAAAPSGPYRLCVSCARADGREQLACFDDPECTSTGSQLANFKIMNPTVGSSGSVTVTTSGPLCIRIYVTGKGSSATITVTPP